MCARHREAKAFTWVTKWKATELWMPGDVSQYKVNSIEENIQRTNSINVQAKVQDATVFDQESELLADIVIADVPCSGYGVIGKKPEIKYRVTLRNRRKS